MLRRSADIVFNNVGGNFLSVTLIFLDFDYHSYPSMLHGSMQRADWNYAFWRATRGALSVLGSVVVFGCAGDCGYLPVASWIDG